jgi:hypothetical protein
MNIREVIAQLQAVAAELPDGLDSQLRVHICHGSGEAALMIDSVEVHAMYSQHKETFEVSDSWAVVQGHPHLDEKPGGRVHRPVTMDVDDVVQQWAAELAGEAPPTPAASTSAEIDQYVDTDTGIRYLLLHRRRQKSIMLELDEQGRIRYLPGAPNSVDDGCLCDPERNNHGMGQASPHDDNRLLIFKDTCPLHRQIDRPSGAEE